MVRALAIAGIALLLDTGAAFAQDPGAPIPLFPSAPPRSIEADAIARTGHAQFAGSNAQRGHRAGAGRLADPASEAGGDRPYLLPSAGDRPGRQSATRCRNAIVDFSASGATPHGRRFSAPRWWSKILRPTGPRRLSMLSARSGPARALRAVC